MSPELASLTWGAGAGTILVRTGRKKSVAVARNGLEIQRIVCVVAKRSPDLLDALVYALFKVDESIASPKLLLNLIAGNDLAGPARQHHQQLERLRREFEYRAIFAQLLQVEV